MSEHGGIQEAAETRQPRHPEFGSQGILTPTPLIATSGAAPTLQISDRMHAIPRALNLVVPPLAVFAALALLWEYGRQLLHIPSYALPPLSTVVRTIPTIDELRHDAFYTSVREALPGFILGSGAGFLMAVVAMRSRFIAKGVIPYAVVSNSMPIIGIAPIAVTLFGDAWQSKAVIVGILTFFPMLINAYRGLTSVDALSLQLMRSYAANGFNTFFKLRLPAALPYIFNGLKINVTLAMIGAIVGEYFGGPAEGLGYYINNESKQTAMAETWAAVIVACAIGIGAYFVMVLLERYFTSWHISYRSGR